MSERTESELDSGTVNSNRVTRDVTRDQQAEGARQATEDANTLRIDSDANDGATGASTGAADPGHRTSR